MEWAVAESLQKVILAEIPDDPFDRHSLPQSISVDDAEQQHHLWDPDEPDRLVKLALHFPDLLDHEEQVLWKLIRENGALWRGNFGAKGIWRWTPSESSIQFPLLRLHWELFVGVARGEKPHAELPGWKKEGPPAKVTKPKPTPDDFDDEVPF
ncbi:hypothetical protein [Pyruvatibacter sp.]|uniref:hypothetical protein n=1 Tax=Pyruvatibacter sp. TaxID=1981328 RepID=UPI003266C78A